MLKKLRNLALIFACMSLIFAGVSCSSSDDDDGTKTNQGSDQDYNGGDAGGGDAGGGDAGGGDAGGGAEQPSYVGTWTGNVTIAGQNCTFSATLNDDDGKTLVVYNSMAGFTDGTWSETNSGVSLTFGEDTVSGKLENGNLVVNYDAMDLEITAENVDTAAYIGTWKGSLESAVSVTLNADGTGTASMGGDNTEALWTVTKDGLVIGIADGEGDYAVIPAGKVKDDGTLVAQYMGQPITLTKDASSGDNGESSANVDYTANFLGIDFSDVITETDDKGNSKLTITVEALYDTALLVYSPKAGIRTRENNNCLNYNGGTANAFAVTTVGETLEETLDRYVGIDVSKLATSGNVTVTFKGEAKTSGKGTDKLGQAVLIDDTSKILDAITNLDIDATGTAEGVTEFTLTATVDAASVKKVILGFSRGGVGGGGIDVTSITAKSAN